jgi:hypothetical protein
LTGEILANEFFRLRNHPLLILVSPLLNLTALFALDQVIRVVTLITGRLAVFDFDDASTRAIKKISIVRNYDEPAGVTL